MSNSLKKKRQKKQTKRRNDHGHCHIHRWGDNAYRSYKRRSIGIDQHLF